MERFECPLASEIPRIMGAYHVDHPGINAMTTSIRQRDFWDNMYQQTEKNVCEYVTTCRLKAIVWLYHTHATILTIKTRLLFVYIYIYIYICNELIEETAGHRKLIFGMWESFGYGSSKF